MKTVAQILKEARLRQRMTRRQIAKQTKIRLKYIKALERNDFSALPEAAFVRGFIRNYANVVGLDPQQALAIFRRDYDQDLTGQVIPRALVQAELRHPSLFTPRLALVVLAVILSGILAVYLIYQYRLLAAAPRLEIETPQDEERVKTTLTLVGRTDPQAVITINNQQVTVSPEGRFEQPLLLPVGTRTITIQATSRSGKTRTLQRTVHVEP